MSKHTDLTIIKLQASRSGHKLMHMVYMRELPWTRLFTIYKRCQEASLHAKTVEASCRLSALARWMSNEMVV